MNASGMPHKCLVVEFEAKDKLVLVFTCQDLIILLNHLLYETHVQVSTEALSAVTDVGRPGLREGDLRIPSPDSLDLDMV